MAEDFRLRVSADYSELLSSSRTVISGLRSELRSLQEQATLRIRGTADTPGTSAGVSQQLAVFQGRGQATLDEAFRRGAIEQTEYNSRLAALANQVENTRRVLSRESEAAGRGPIAAPSSYTVERSRSAQTTVFTQQNAAVERTAAAQAAVARAAEEQAAQQAAAALEGQRILEARRTEQTAVDELVSATRRQAEQQRTAETTGAQQRLQAAIDAHAAAEQRAAELLSERMVAEAERASGNYTFTRTPTPEPTPEGEAGARAAMEESLARLAGINNRAAGLMEQGMSAEEAHVQAVTELAATQTRVAFVERQLIAQGIEATAARTQAEREVAVAERREALAADAAAIAAEQQANAQRSASRIGPGGSFFQRAQAFIASRPGGSRNVDEQGNAVAPDPGNYQSFGQFFTSKALTTGGFALSGAVLYGGVQAFRDIIKEASSLQRELAVVHDQFNTIGGAADELGRNKGFADFAKQAVDISVDTGIAADEVVRVSRQLAGVFKTDTGLPDFNRSLQETHQALKLSQVTGLPYQEITDSLTAITSTYHVSFTEIGDLAIGLEQKFGVLAPELIQFTADLAPVAKQLGFTLEQITALGAIAQQRSGVSGGALAESFNRALPTLQQQQTKLVELFAQRPATENLVNPILDSLGQGQGARAIEQLTDAYGKMSAAQRNALAELLGGQRNAKAFFAVLEGGQQTIDALNGKDFNFAGKLDQRFTDFQATVEFAFESAKRALEQFGIALFNSGIADGLKLIADNGAVLIKGLSELVHLFTSLNDALGGIPVKLGAIYLAMRAMSALAGAFQLGGFLAVLGARSGRGGTPAGPAGRDIVLPGEEIAAAGALSARQAKSPILRGALGAQQLTHIDPLTGAAGETELVASAGKFRTAMAGAVEALAPVLAVAAVAELVQTVANVRADTKSSIGTFDEKVADLVKQGTDPTTILNKIKSAGGGSSGAIDQLVNFGQETNQVTEGLNEIQRQHSTQQGEELAAILKGADQHQREALAKIITDSHGVSRDLLHPALVEQQRLVSAGGLEDFVKSFLDDPANDDKNAAVARMIDYARNAGFSPETIKALQDIGDKYANAIQANVDLKAASDYAPVLEEVKTRFANGDASLQEFLAAEDHEIKALTTALTHIVDPTVRAQTAQQLGALAKERDATIKGIADKVANLSIKLAAAHGDNAPTATFDAKLTELRTLVAQGASPDTQLDAGLAALDAQQAVLQQAINAPVIVNGIARAPTTAEKIFRAAKGIPISAELRSAIIRASLLTGANTGLAQEVAKQTGNSIDAIITAVARIATDADHSLVDGMLAVLDSKMKSVQLGLKNIEPDDKDERDKLNQTYQALSAARTALDTLSANASKSDPGTDIHPDVTDLKNQKLLDDAAEAKALQEAYAALARANAHGDPVAVANANLQAARTALQFAQASGKPSEVVAAQAQLADAQNSLDDAQEGVVQAQYSFAIDQARGNPVAQALLRVAALREAANHVHGEAERLNNLAQQADAEQALTDAVNAVVYAQIGLAQAIAQAAGDGYKAAQIGLWDAAVKLNDLLRSGADPNGAAVLAAQQQVVAAQANVRDQQIATQERDIDFALQMERITTGQAIAQLQALLQIPNLTVEQTQQILLKIKQLQDELGRDLQFNLPTEIRVPTLYEVRRLNQSGSGTPGGGPAYQDNRQIDVKVYATTGATATDIANATAAAIGPTRVNGTQPRKYGL